MNLIEAEELATSLIAQHVPSWTFRWDRALTTFGTADSANRTITLSKPHTAAAGEASVLDTILHEIAHAIVGPAHNHDRVWQRKARELGARPESSTSEAEAGNLRASAPWVQVCPNGHQVGKRYFRKPTGRKAARSCGICSPHRFDASVMIELKKIS